MTVSCSTMATSRPEKPWTCRLSLPRVTEEYCKALVSMGTYGTRPQDAAGILIYKAIDALIEKGVLKRRPSDDPL